jgi:hypothetical protein
LAAFGDDEIDACIPIWNLFQNGAVTLFRGRDLWDQTLALLQAHSYRIIVADCFESDEPTLLFSIVDALQIPRFPDINLDGFNDFMSQIDFGDDTGVVICLDRYDDFHDRFPKTAQSILDILADAHRHEILVGNRLATIVQSSNATIDRSIGKIGGFTPQWNTNEWMNRDRGL